jgi:phage-related protein
MLGFKGETGYTLADTYLGKQNVLSIGVGYRVVGQNGPDPKMWTADILYEQKFGDIVPNLQVGYINKRIANQRASQLYAQAQLLYDQMVGFGKPALAVRFEQNQNKNVDTDTSKDEPRVTRFGVWAHYYIKGQNAKVSLGVDSVRLNSEASNRTCTDVSVSGNCRNFTDVTLQFQTQF